ncbi:hypothetical protein EXIGLDRAFT_847083 [Exidia glandulosa HHB12029]|uniref:INO80 complex subunit B-like conserved region domain-containing protein n=1 Tax=Exidia glandulosa HHB12029 TaxID=1314781 RepID=A0A166N8C3_EXIGL|nr:hypothetical protein EXIGLDRAFT_847083 [Exidia glandulosa HHB12029]
MPWDKKKENKWGHGCRRLTASVSQTPVPRKPKLKIKPRLNHSAAIASASTSAAPTPTPVKRPHRRIKKRKRTPSEDGLKSEDGESPCDYFNPDADDEDESSRAPRRWRSKDKDKGKDADQDVPAVELSHWTLMALKKEESARKRRNLTEKKLEDEKVRLPAIITTPSSLQESMNRLLRKQGRRGAREVEEDDDDDDAEDADAVPLPVEPAFPMFRWVSSAKGMTFTVPRMSLPASCRTMTEPSASIGLYASRLSDGRGYGSCGLLNAPPGRAVAQG